MSFKNVSEVSTRTSQGRCGRSKMHRREEGSRLYQQREKKEERR
jgi:hypothetical protein